MIEARHSTLESELRSREQLTTQARAKVAARIEDYDRHRYHSALAMMSPVDYEWALAAG